MTISTPELEQILGISRYQISRYAADGRLTRTAHGAYDASSIANLYPAFGTRDMPAGTPVDEARELFLVRSKHAFRRALVSVFQRRYEAAGKWGSVTLAAAQQREFEAAVEAFVKALAARPDR